MIDKQIIRSFLNLLLYRTASELRSEGARTYAGYLWWILEPLMSLAVYYVAFKYIFQRKTENFALFLFIGIVIYRFFTGTVIRSARSMIDGKGLMQLVYVHKSIFPLSVVLVNLVKFMIAVGLVLVVVWIAGFMPTWAYIALPLLILTEILFVTGISMICAGITPFFPDFQLILGTIMHLLLFLSGVLYDIGKLSPDMQRLIRLNPVATIIEQFRIVLLQGQWPDLRLLLPAVAISVICIGLGWLIIHKYDRHYPKIS